MNEKNVVVSQKEDSNNLTNLNEWALESSYCSLERAYFHAKASLKSQLRGFIAHKYRQVGELENYQLHYLV